MLPWRPSNTPWDRLGWPPHQSCFAFHRQHGHLVGVHPLLSEAEHQDPYCWEMQTDLAPYCVRAWNNHNTLWWLKHSHCVSNATGSFQGVEIGTAPKCPGHLPLSRHYVLAEASLHPGLSFHVSLSLCKARAVPEVSRNISDSQNLPAAEVAWKCPRTFSWLTWDLTE